MNGVIGFIIGFCAGAIIVIKWALAAGEKEKRKEHHANGSAAQEEESAQAADAATNITAGNARTGSPEVTPQLAVIACNVIGEYCCKQTGCGECGIRRHCRDYFSKTPDIWQEVEAEDELQKP